MNPNKPASRNELVSPSRYATMARRHYEMWLGDQLSLIPESERDSFYSTLGDQIAEQVESVEMALRGPDPAGESFMERLGRFNMAHLQAEEMALAEMLPAPEEDAEQPVAPVMDDLEIIVRHKLDPEAEDPEARLSQQAQLDYWRQYYRQLGRRVGLD